MESYSVEAVLSATDKGFTRAMGEANKQLNGLDGNAKKSKSSIMSIAAGVGAFKLVSVAVNMVKDSVGEAIQRFDTLNNYPKVMQRVGFSAQEADRSLSKLNKGIQGLPTSLDSIAKSTQSIALITDDLDVATDTALALNNAFLASGASSDEASRGTQQYTKMLSQGKVNMTSWMTLQDTMGYGLRKIADAFGFAGESATNDLYQALQDGRIPMSEFNAKLIELDQGVDGFASVAKTATAGVGTAWTNLKTAIVRETTKIIEEIDKSLEAFGGLEGVIDLVKEAFSVMLRVLGELINNGIKLLVSAVKVLEKQFGGVLKVIGDVIKKGFTILITTIQVLTKNMNVIVPVVATFMGLWATNKLLAFVGQAGSVTKALLTMTKALFGTTAAKIKDKAETITLQALYAKDAIASAVSATKKALETIAIKANTVAKGLEAKATAASTVATTASTTAVGLQTVALKAGAVAAKLFSAAMSMMSSPIGLAITGITAVVGVIGGLCAAFGNAGKSMDATAQYQDYLNEKFRDAETAALKTRTAFDEIAEQSLPKINEGWIGLTTTLTKFSLTKNTEDIKGLAKDTEEYTKDVSESVKNYQDQVYQGAVEYYTKYGDRQSKEAQENLQKIADYHQTQQDNMQEHINGLLKLQDTKEKKGTLNAEEQIQYQAHLDALNQIAINTITPEQARELAEQESFLQKKGNLNAQEQEKFAKSLQESAQQNEETIKTSHGQQIHNLNQTYDTLIKNAGTNQDEINRLTQEKEDKKKEIINKMNGEIQQNDEAHYKKLIEGVSGHTTDEIKEYNKLTNDLAQVTTAIHTNNSAFQKGELQTLEKHLKDKIKGMNINADDVKKINELSQKEGNEGFEKYWNAQKDNTKYGTGEVKRVLDENKGIFKDSANDAIDSVERTVKGSNKTTNAWRNQGKADGDSYASGFNNAIQGKNLSVSPNGKGGGATGRSLLPDLPNLGLFAHSITSFNMPDSPLTRAPIVQGTASKFSAGINAVHTSPIARRTAHRSSNNTAQTSKLANAIVEAISGIEVHHVTEMDGKVIAEKVTPLVDRAIGKNITRKLREV